MSTFGVMVAQSLGDWTTYTPAWEASTTNPVIGNGTLTGKYYQIGKLLVGRIFMRAGSTTTFGSGEWKFGLPDGFTAAFATGETNLAGGAVWALDSGTTWKTGVLQMPSSAPTRFGVRSTDVAVAWRSDLPMTWAVNDVLSAEYQVEIV